VVNLCSVLRRFIRVNVAVAGHQDVAHGVHSPNHRTLDSIATAQCKVTVLRGSLKTDLQAHGKGPAAGQFVVKIERVEIVVLVGEVEQGERDLGFSM
jgi:hypothetical protein